MSTDTANRAPKAPVRGIGAALRGGATYSLVIAVQGVSQFLLIPVYTRAFTASEYGQLGVAISIALFANALLTFGLELAVIRAYFTLRSEPTKQRSALATLGVATLVLPMGTAIALSLVAVPALDGALTPSLYLVLAVLGSAVFVSATVLPVALLRAEDRFRDYLIVYATLISANIVLTAVFVLLFHWGPAGSLLGTLIANAAGLCVAARRLPWPRPENLSRTYLLAALAIGLPMVPHLVSSWALQLSDRAILGGLVSDEQVGVYSLAVNLAVPVLALLSAFSQAVHPSYGTAIHDCRARAVLSELVHLQIVATCLITAAVALLGPVVVSIAIPPSFASAAGVIPWLALGYGLWGLYAIPMNALSILAGRTTWTWTVTILTAALRIGSLYWLVPAYGIIAAAVSLPICNLVLLGGMALMARFTAGARVAYDWTRGGAVIAATVVIVVPVLFVTGMDTLPDLAARLAAIAALPVAFLAGGGATRDQRRRLLASVRDAARG